MLGCTGMVLTLVLQGEVGRYVEMTEEGRRMDGEDEGVRGWQEY